VGTYLEHILYNFPKRNSLNQTRLLNCYRVKVLVQNSDKNKL